MPMRWPRPFHVAALVLVLILSACSGTGASTSATPSIPGSPPTMAEPSAPTAAPTGSVGGTASPSPAPSAATGLDSDELHALTVTDVRDGSAIRLGDLAAQQPLLVETMAIWCTNCRAQMHNVVAAHDLADFHSLSIDVDPGEQPDDLADYAEREGFDWPFAMAEADLLSVLRERFGSAVALPPSMPKILFRTDGSIELIGLGQLLSPEQIAAAVGG